MLLVKREKGLTSRDSKLQPKSNTEYTDDASGVGNDQLLAFLANSVSL